MKTYTLTIREQYNLRREDDIRDEWEDHVKFILSQYAKEYDTPTPKYVLDDLTVALVHGDVCNDFDAIDNYIHEIISKWIRWVTS